MFYDNESCNDNVGIESDNEVRLEPLIEEEENNVPSISVNEGPCMSSSDTMSAIFARFDE